MGKLINFNTYKISLFFLGLLFVFLMPTSEHVGGNRPWYVFFAICSLLVGAVGLYSQIPIRRKLIESVLYLSAFSVMVSVSILGNMNVLVWRDFLEVLRPFACILFILFGYFSVYKLNVSSLWAFFIFIIVFQCLMVSFSFFYDPRKIDLLSFFWDFSKYRSWRGIGTFSNPNRLGFFTIVIYFGLLCLRHNTFFAKILITLAAFGLLMVSSSRTSLLCWGVLLLLYIVLNEKSLLKSFVKIAMMIAGAAILIAFMKPYLEIRFKYLYDFLNHFHTPLHFLGISSVRGRVDNWQGAYTFFTSGLEMRWFIGHGPGKGSYFKILDNDYLYVIVKYGLLGALVFYGFWRSVALNIIRSKNHNSMKTFLMFYLLALGFFGLTSESFSSWILTIPFFIFYGVLLRSEPNPENSA